MASKLLISLTICATFAFNSTFAQYDDEDYLGNYDILSIGAGAGILTYFGDLGADNEISNFTNARTGFSFNLDRRFGGFMSAQLGATFGKLAYNEISPDYSKRRNFEADIKNFNLNFIFNFDNDFMIHRKSSFSPYLGVGIAYMLFDSKGDLKDANGIDYHYWSDGSIRSLSETDPMASSASVLTRDYTYESQLEDPTSDYARNTITIPLTAGFKWKFSPKVQGRLFATYNLTQTDWIDNVESEGNNDNFLLTGMSLQLTITKKDPNKIDYKSLNLNEIDQEDSDKDGVIDLEDYCQNTPPNVEVDKDGCPVDNDQDGVPDFLDKELNTKIGAIVNQDGESLTDEVMKFRYESYRDSITSERVEFSSVGGSETAVSEPKKHAEIPADLQDADLDKNGEISPAEISSAIDGFFEGTNEFSAKTLQELIEYFFEQ